MKNPAGTSTLKQHWNNVDYQRWNDVDLTVDFESWNDVE